MRCPPASWLHAFTGAMWCGLAVMVILCWCHTDMIVAATITSLYIIALAQAATS